MKKNITGKVHGFFEMSTIAKITQGGKNAISVLFIIVACGGTAIYVLGTGRMIVIATCVF